MESARQYPTTSLPSSGPPWNCTTHRSGFSAFGDALLIHHPMKAILFLLWATVARSFSLPTTPDFVPRT